MDSKGAAPWWPSLLPIAGCGAFAASTLSIYYRDVAAQLGCAGTIVCGDFRADPRALVAGVGFGMLAVVLLLGTVVAVRSDLNHTRGSRWLAPVVSLAVAASFLTLVAVIEWSNAGASVVEVIPVAIWAFLGVGFVSLWVATVFRDLLVGAWRGPAWILALFHGAVVIATTLVTLARAIGPGPGFL